MIGTGRLAVSLAGVGPSRELPEVQVDLVPTGPLGHQTHPRAPSPAQRRAGAWVRVGVHVLCLMPVLGGKMPASAAEMPACLCLVLPLV